MMRPAEICSRLLAALDASEGRRRRRKRDTTPDAIGLTIKRRLLEQAVLEDPDPDDFEGWLLQQCVPAAGHDRTSGEPGLSTATGPVRALALDLLAEWRLAQRSEAFRSWLERGAPSDDGNPG